MKCSKCGNEYMDHLAACPVCFEKDRESGVDSNAFAYGVFGFFLPFVALYQAKQWETGSPMKAATARNGARLGFAFWGACAAVFFIVAIVMTFVD